MDYQTMETAELERIVDTDYDACMEVMRRNNFSNYWRFVKDPLVDDVDEAAVIARHLLEGNNEAAMQYVRELFARFLKEEGVIDDDDVKVVLPWEDPAYRWDETSCTWKKD